MNGIELLFLIATIGQAPAPQSESDYGWLIGKDGKLEYIVQLTPTEWEQLRTGEFENPSDIPPELIGRASRIVIRVGTQKLPREPSLQDIEKLYPLGAASNNGAPGGIVPPGFTAGNFKQLENPALYSVAGSTTQPSLASNDAGRSAIDPSKPDTLSATLGGAGAGIGLPSANSALPNIGDASLLAQSGAPSRFLNDERNPLNNTGTNQNAQGASRFQSAPKPQSGQQYSGTGLPQTGQQSSTAGSATAPSFYDRNIGNSATIPASPNVGLQNGLGAGSSTYSPTIPPPQSPGFQNGPAVANNYQPSSGNFTGTPRTQIGQSASAQAPIPNYGQSGPLMAGLPGNPSEAYGGYTGYQASQLNQAAAQNQSGFAGNQAGIPTTNSYSQANGLGNVPPSLANQSYLQNQNSQAQQLDPRTHDPSYRTAQLDTVAARSNFPPQTESLESRGNSPIDQSRNASRTLNDPEGVNGVLQVFFLLSLVVNFYLGLLIRKLLARYRSLLGSVRSQAA